jgi:hypothetical protein
VLSTNAHLISCPFVYILYQSFWPMNTSVNMCIHRKRQFGLLCLSPGTMCVLIWCNMHFFFACCPTNNHDPPITWYWFSATFINLIARTLGFEELNYLFFSSKHAIFSIKIQYRESLVFSPYFLSNLASHKTTRADPKCERCIQHTLQTAHTQRFPPLGPQAAAQTIGQQQHARQMASEERPTTMITS